jgi:peptide-methionine (S)-S-oxide reductase
MIRIFRLMAAIAMLVAMFVAIFPSNMSADDTAQPVETASAIFGGGCFWCVESDFEKLPGVIEAESGYIGGQIENPTYEQVSGGASGHVEVARIHYDPSKISYAELLDYFWRHIDPTVENRQFCDVAPQYLTAIFYNTDAEKTVAMASKAALENSGKFKTIYTEVSPAGTFYRAEEYHQDYYKKNPLRYKFYRTSCGRDARLKEVWGT